MKTYYNGLDGHTYYLRDGNLLACPTLINGTPEFESEIDTADIFACDNVQGTDFNAIKKILEGE